MGCVGGWCFMEFCFWPEDEGRRQRDEGGVTWSLDSDQRLKDTRMVRLVTRTYGPLVL